MKNINAILSKILFAVLIQYMPYSLSSQNYFQKVYPTTYDKTSRDILPTSDGGYIIAGSTNTSTVTDCDVYVMKTDASGNLVWNKQFGGNKPDYAYSMVETTDGNYFITGFSQSFGGGDYDIYVIKIDPSGNLIWQKTYGSWGNEEAREIIKTSDNNYMLVGYTTSSTTSQDAYLMKIDLAGTMLWTKYYGGSNKEFGNSVKQCSDGGYIMTGQTFSWGQNGDTYLVRTNSTGDTLWTRMFGSPLADEGVCVVTNNDDSFAFVVRDSSSADVDVRVIKTDANGTMLWNKLYGSSQKDTPKSICTTSDGGYFIGAISRSFGWINPDMWLLKLNSSGDTLWSKHFGSSDHEHCHKAKEWDNGYIAVGHSRSYGPGQKVMFVKMNNNGDLVASVKEQFANAAAVKVFPNPSSGGIINFSLEEDPLRIKLSNAMGQVVHESIFSLNNNKVGELDLGKQEEGIYFLNIETEKGVISKKIIIGN
jgi:hypothetical protein